MAKERLLSWAIGALALMAPLAIGGAHATTQVLLSLGALLLAAAYAGLAEPERALSRVALFWPALIAVAFTALQLLPLPASLVELLSPAAHELRGDTGGGGLMPLTVDVPATWLALARGFACFGLLLVVSAQARSHRNARPILVALVATGALVASITLLQRAVGAQKILGFYQPESTPGGGFFGPFVSANHAASLLGLSSLIALGLALDSNGGKRLAFIGCSALSGTVVFYTASRMGAVGYAVGLLMLTSVVLVRRLGWATGVFTAVALMAVTSGVALWAADGLRSRLMPSSPEVLYENQKLRGWKDAASMTLAYRWTGVGRGAFEAPAAAFRQDDEGVRLPYPENLGLQMSSEWGVPVTLLLLGLAGAALVKLAPGLRRRELGVIGAASGVVAVLVHELADFGLELPGVAFPTVIALGVAVGRIERRQERESLEARTLLTPRQVAVGLVAWAVALVGAAWAVPRTLDADFRKVSESYKQRDPGLDKLLQASIARHPAEDHFELVAAEDALRHKSPSALHHLNRALRLHPANWQAHYLAARTLLNMGRRSQAALEHRMAMERGLPATLDEILALLGSAVVDGFPQRPDALMRLAHGLAQRHKPLDADAAAQRAVSLTAAPGPVLTERVQVAIEAGDARTLVPAAEALLEAQPDPESGVVAIKALALTGDVKATEAALQRMLKLHPDSSLLVLVGAQLRFDRNDLGGARALLKHAGDGSYSLADRLRAEELLAKIADRDGDVDGAVLARARARLIAHKLNDTSQQ
jgi:hypothetical protein